MDEGGKSHAARAVPSAFVGEGAYDKRRGSLLPRGGRAFVKRLGKVDWTITFDFVCTGLKMDEGGKSHAARRAMYLPSTSSSSSLLSLLVLEGP